jgi:hypothetical protein
LAQNDVKAEDVAVTPTAICRGDFRTPQFSGVTQVTDNEPWKEDYSTKGGSQYDENNA